jgi:hypothetical protein
MIERIRSIHTNKPACRTLCLDDSAHYSYLGLQVTVRWGLVIKHDHQNIAQHVRAYRRRIAAAGEQEVLFKLSNETVAVIDDLKKRLGLRNRGQVLEQLIERGREFAQQ